jgi:Xaa-Pro aminopeptidase
VLFAAEEPVLDFMPYRQDEDFYYLTGWNEPGAALLIVGDAPQAQTPRAYKEILFLPTRDLRMEKYTGAKLDAVSPNVVEATGVDAVEPMTELPAVLNRLIDSDRRLNIWLSLTLPLPRRWWALPPQRLVRARARRPATSPLSPAVARGQGRGRD